MSHLENFLAFIYFFFLWVYMKKKNKTTFSKASFLNSSEVYLEMKKKKSLALSKGEEAPMLHNSSVSLSLSAL